MGERGLIGEMGLDENMGLGVVRASWAEDIDLPCACCQGLNTIWEV